jgi:hypothetical protein
MAKGMQKKFAVKAPAKGKVKKKLKAGAGARKAMMPSKTMRPGMMKGKKAKKMGKGMAWMVAR